jgi:orotidine-5'-phosphate decarboxylase
VVAAAAEDNAGADPGGHVGLVVGATVGDAPERLGLDLAAANAVLLTPGVGAQGGTPSDLARTFAGIRGRVLAPVGRALLQAGPAVPALRAAVDRLAEELARTLGK